ncbi:DUF1656 domain-containing protein [Caulobacter sp. CCUG 60055]|uniref:DUF1656 domain-containing protein n=1 Tax=Caulobacter sp. CCUG 60055 TaxID=2100090 RepID=UPI001FA79BE1|nr:DUF1656 domain-containing protein [Caulobacter sp. CCUG 60055]MBQ1541014.1 DUF1656 domain-containing protein [Caulobacteraceae bacterium]MCI3179080.1 DUF1656 domain-containing protein [Caulobacter sp. CCUG 60055]
MIREFDVQGVLLSSVLVSALIAFAGSFLLRKALSRLGAYRFVWHPALFDVALFVILWGLVVCLPLPLLS